MYRGLHAKEFYLFLYSIAPKRTLSRLPVNTMFESYKSKGPPKHLGFIPGLKEYCFLGINNPKAKITNILELQHFHSYSSQQLIKYAYLPTQAHCSEVLFSRAQASLLNRLIAGCILYNYRTLN